VSQLQLAIACRNPTQPASVMGNEGGKRPWLQGTTADTSRRTARETWLGMVYRSAGAVVTPFATKELRVAKRTESSVVGRAPQVEADLVDMGFFRTGTKACVSFANADCIGVMIIAHRIETTGAEEDMNIPPVCKTMEGGFVIGGHVGDAHIKNFCGVLASYLSGNMGKSTVLQASEVYIVRGRSLIKKWSDDKEENATGRLARLLYERFPYARVSITGEHTENLTLAFPTSRTREATKIFLDDRGIAPELGDNLLERLKKMPPSLTQAYHKITNGLDFGDRHGLVMELTV